MRTHGEFFIRASITRSRSNAPGAPPTTGAKPYAEPNPSQPRAYRVPSCQSIDGGVDSSAGGLPRRRDPAVVGLPPSFPSLVPVPALILAALLLRWYEDNEPESIAIPDYENRIIEQVLHGAKHVGKPFGKPFVKTFGVWPRDIPEPYGRPSHARRPRAWLARVSWAALPLPAALGRRSVKKGRSQGAGVLCCPIFSGRGVLLEGSFCCFVEGELSVLV